MPTTTSTTLTPYLTCRDAERAVRWYQDVFGAEVVGAPYVMDDGRIGHAELRLAGAATFYLSDEYPEHGAISPQSVGASTMALVLEVPDVDEVYRRAVDAGAIADRLPADQPYGARSGWLVDPFGHRWSIQTPLAAGSAT